MNQHKNDEIDLIYFFSKLKKTLRGWVKLFFKIIDHLIRNWKIISVLIVLGIILGYFAQQNYKPAQKATALIRVNFDAVDYVYSEIDLLNEKHNMIKKDLELKIDDELKIFFNLQDQNYEDY